MYKNSYILVIILITKNLYLDRGIMLMEYISKTIGSTELSGIFEIPPLLRNKRVQVIVLPAEDDNMPDEQKPQKRLLGFAKGAEIPDSFFEPLPEEELQLWGL